MHIDNLVYEKKTNESKLEYLNVLFNAIKINLNLYIDILKKKNDSLKKFENEFNSLPSLYFMELSNSILEKITNYKECNFQEDQEKIIKLYYYAFNYEINDKQRKELMELDKKYPNIKNACKTFYSGNIFLYYVEFKLPSTKDWYKKQKTIIDYENTKKDFDIYVKKYIEIYDGSYYLSKMCDLYEKIFNCIYFFNTSSFEKIKMTVDRIKKEYNLKNVNKVLFYLTMERHSFDYEKDI